MCFIPYLFTAKINHFLLNTFFTFEILFEMLLFVAVKTLKYQWQELKQNDLPFVAHALQTAGTPFA